MSAALLGTRRMRGPVWSWSAPDWGRPAAEAASARMALAAVSLASLVAGLLRVDPAVAEDVDHPVVVPGRRGVRNAPVPGISDAEPAPRSGVLGLPDPDRTRLVRRPRACPGRLRDESGRRRAPHGGRG